MPDCAPSLKPTAITARLTALRTRITRAEKEAGRAAGSVTLVAVGKTFGSDMLRAVAAAGVRSFGENYLQEALVKQGDLADLHLDWHFIGAIQSRKVRALAECFDWVHTVDREKIAYRLAAARPSGQAPLQVCIQVNLDGEASKAGVAPTAARDLVETVRALQGLSLRGLMALPAPRTDPTEQRMIFTRLADLAAEIRSYLPTADARTFNVLSMGMSHDLEAAVAAGATHVRIGSALFGPRTTPV